jgi:aminopeptidase
MKTKSIIFVLFLVSFMAGCDKKVSNDVDKAKVQPATDYEVLAQKLVNQVANVKEGEIVSISGGIKNIELLENIAINVKKNGGYPLLTIGSDRMIKRYFTDVPSKYDSRTSELDLKLNQIIDVYIDVDFNESITLYDGVPSDRQTAIQKASIPVSQLFQKRNIRYVNLGNALHPTEELAKQYNIPLEEFSKIFWDGVNVDYTKLQSTAEAVKNILVKGKEIQITNPNGTDFKVRIEGKPVITSDGVITDDKIKKGYPYCTTYLPAGEVYLAPVKGTANGKIIVDKQYYFGKFIEGLELIFAAGKLTSMTAKSGLEKLKAMYDAGDQRKDEFSLLDIGINPNMPYKTGSDLAGFMMSGIITVGHGRNDWAQGDNASSFNVVYFLKGCTLKVDGKILIENGVLKI